VQLTCLGAGSLSQRYKNISRQRPTRSALINALDSRANPRIIAENRSLETNCRSSTLFVDIARTTKAAENGETFVTVSPSVHVKASRHICNAGMARPLCVRRKLQTNHNFLHKFVGLKIFLSCDKKNKKTRSR
jgi:hypothetical protein